MTTPPVIPNPHPVGTRAWANHEDEWFRQFHATGGLHRLLEDIATYDNQYGTDDTE